MNAPLTPNSVHERLRPTAIDTPRQERDETPRGRAVQRRPWQARPSTNAAWVLVLAAWALAASGCSASTSEASPEGRTALGSATTRAEAGEGAEAGRMQWVAQGGQEAREAPSPDQPTKPTPTQSGPAREVAEPGRQRGMTAAHNRARASIPAKPALPPMRWSSELASQAQAWADRLSRAGCNLEHSSDRYGENIAFFSGTEATPERVVDEWMSEGRCYTYGPFLRGDRCSSRCNDSGGCGHYTQVIWRSTEVVGCGMAQCADRAEIWVCKYDPAGNRVGSRPY